MVVVDSVVGKVIVDVLGGVDFGGVNKSADSVGKLPRYNLSALKAVGEGISWFMDTVSLTLTIMELFIRTTRMKWRSPSERLTVYT